jgi:lactate racemase
MASVLMEFGRGLAKFEVPEGRFLGHVRPRETAAVPDVGNAVRAAITNPIRGRPLADLAAAADKALVLTVDYTRPSPRELLEPVLATLAEQSVETNVCIAGGRHRLMSDEEVLAHLGNDICSAYPIMQHDSFDAGAHAELGTTSRGTPIRVDRVIFDCDLVIAVGFIEPTYLAGFSGARKMLMPGMAWHEAIDANHYLITDPNCRVGVLDGNPISEDMEDFARELPLDFIVYSVVGPHDETTAVVAGNRYQAHRAGCRLSGNIFRVRGPMADIVISSAGGYPYDCDLVQGKKAIIPAHELVKPGGVIIIVAEAEEKWGAETTFVDWLRNYTPEAICKRVRDRAQFSLGAHGARILARPVVEHGAQVIALVGKDFVDDLSETFVQATADPQEAMSWAMQRVGDAGSIVAVHQARRLMVEAEQ